MEKYYQHVFNNICDYLSNPYNEISLAPLAPAIYNFRSDTEGLAKLCDALENLTTGDKKYDNVMKELEAFLEKRIKNEVMVCKIMLKISEDSTTHDYIKEIEKKGNLREYAESLYNEFLKDLSEKERSDFCGYLVYNDDYVKYQNVFSLNPMGHFVWSMGDVETELLRLCDFYNHSKVLDYIADLSDALAESAQQGYSFNESISADDAIVLNKLFGEDIFKPQEDDRIILPEIS